MKRHSVHFIDEAERDIAEIILHIAEHDCVERAEHVLLHLEKVCADLAHFPAKGHVPPGWVLP